MSDRPVTEQPRLQPWFRGVRIGFIVRDLDALHRRVAAAGADVLHPPREEPWGRLARYRDPDGDIVGVTQFG